MLPAWVGWLGFVLGLISLTPAGFFAFLVVLVWIAIVSVMLYQRQGPAAPAQTALPTA